MMFLKRNNGNETNDRKSAATQHSTLAAE